MIDFDAHSMSSFSCELSFDTFYLHEDFNKWFDISRYSLCIHNINSCVVNSLKLYKKYCRCVVTFNHNFKLLSKSNFK